MPSPTDGGDGYDDGAASFDESGGSVSSGGARSPAAGDASNPDEGEGAPSADDDDGVANEDSGDFDGEDDGGVSDAGGGISGADDGLMDLDEEEEAAVSDGLMPHEGDALIDNNDLMDDAPNDDPIGDLEDDGDASENDESSANDKLSSSSPPPERPTKTVLGGPNGSNGKPAYALLVGKVEIGDGEFDDEVVTIPITRLPITLGKEHPTKDPSFVGLKEGPHVAESHITKMSQSMCSIFYRDAFGGRLGLYKKGRKKESHSADGDDEKKGEADFDPLDGMIYKPYEIPIDDEKSHPAPDEILRPPGVEADAPLPATGFFAVECTGRKITVSGRVIKKGQFAVLKSGMSIRIASHCLYFLLPESRSQSDGPSKPPPSITVKVTTPTKAIKPEKVASSKMGSDKREAAGDDDEPPSKRPKTSHEELIASIEEKSDVQLMGELSERARGDPSAWGKYGQSVGTALATRACRAAARSPSIQTIVRSEGGATQREILDWMKDSPESVFGEYESLMLGKIEKKSFMMSMGKAIVRAGYTKNEFLSGRAFRWNLPEDVPSAGDGSGAGAGAGDSTNDVKPPAVQSNEGSSVGGDDASDPDSDDGDSDERSVEETI